MKRVGWLCLSVVCGGAALAADRTWQSAGGDWVDAANWSGSSVPGAADTAVFNNALSGDAVVNMDGAGPVMRLRVDTPVSDWTRVFTGTLNAGTNIFIRGRTELRGTLSSDSRYAHSVGESATQTAWLTLAEGAVFAHTNRTGLYLGNVNNAKGRVTVKDGARLSLSTADTDNGISLGRNTGSVGSFVQEGGRVESVGRFLPGYNGYGAYELLGGTLNLPYGSSETRYRLAVQANSTGLFYQRGGELYVLTNGLMSTTNHFEIGSGNANTRAVYYADGGYAKFDVQVRLLSGASVGSSPTYAELTIDGDAVVEQMGTFYVRQSSASFSSGVTAVNLNRGGTLRLANLENGTNSGSGRKALNADGGVLEFIRSSELDLTASRNLAATMYEGGLGVRLPGTAGVLVNGMTLRGAEGHGVASLALTDGGSDYLAPPVVLLDGGAGSNATAVAFIDHASGAVTGLVVTCRGEGYGAGDALTVSFTGGGGSGAAATATLAPNKTGPLFKTGTPRLAVYGQPVFDGEYVVNEGLLLQSTRDQGAPNLRAVRVSGDGAVFQNNSGSVGDNTPAKWDFINPLAVLGLGGDLGGGEATLVCGSADTVFRQSYAALELGFGRNRLTTASQNATNGATFAFGTLTRKPGAALTVASVTNLSVTVASGAVNSIIPGVNVGIVTELATLDGNGRIVALKNYDEGFGVDSNLYLTASAAADGFEVNSLRMDDAKTLTLQEGGTTVIGSGVAIALSGSGAFTTIKGGALTSGNGTDLILTDFHINSERRNLSNGKSGLVADTVIADNGATPVALFALGRTWDSSMSIAAGPVVELKHVDNTYSGGTYILDTALAIAGNGSLGPVPVVPTNNIFTSGMAMLRAPADASTVSLHANRRIRVSGGGLTFFGDTGAQAGRVLFDVAGDISGKGVLVMNHWAGDGMLSAVVLRGDNSGFQGNVAVHGLLRLTGERSLPLRAGLVLCDRSDKNAAGGIIEMAGRFDRAPGTGAGQVYWGQANNVAPGYVGNNSTANGGGFSAFGGPLTVNLGGDRRTLTLGADGFAPARLRLQSDYATGELTWENPVDVTNRTLIVQVANAASGKVAIWRGAVSSSDEEGGGAFTKAGAGRLVLADGADFGRLSFTANNTLGLQVSNRLELACDMRGGDMFIEKDGVGCVVMSGSNTYAQATRIREGSLVVNGTNTGGGTFTVGPDAALGGTGVVAPKSGATVTVNGTLAPGATDGIYGTLMLGREEQATTLDLDGRLEIKFGADACDRVTVFGDVSFGANAAVAVVVPDDAVWQARRGETIPVLTWTGDVSGTAALPLAEALPVGWKVKMDVAAKTAWLMYAPLGTIITVQ